MGLQTEEKTVVVPGEVLAQGLEYLPSAGTYRDGDRIVAARLGIVKLDGKVITTMPISGRYLPKVGDVIVCSVEEILMSGWRVDTNSAYSAVLPLKDATSEYIERGADLSKYYDIGDCIIAQVTNVTSQNLVDITMRGPGLRKLAGGRIVTVNTHKVPRVIGKHGSMVSLIKEHTGCQLLVGQNGRVWIRGTSPAAELLTVEVVKKIEKEAHISGLTDRVKAFLVDEVKKRKITVDASFADEPADAGEPREERRDDRRDRDGRRDTRGRRPTNNNRRGRR